MLHFQTLENTGLDVAGLGLARVTHAFSVLGVASYLRSKGTDYTQQPCRYSWVLYTTCRCETQVL